MSQLPERWVDVHQYGSDGVWRADASEAERLATLWDQWVAAPRSALDRVIEFTTTQGSNVRIPVSSICAIHEQTLEQWLEHFRIHALFEKEQEKATGF